MSKIQKTKFNDCEVVTCGLTKEQHDVAVEMVKNDPFDLMQYNFKEVDLEMANVWIADAFSEGDEEYAHFLQKAIADGADLYTLTRDCGWEQPLGEVALFKVEDEELRENAEKMIYQMFSDWDISDAGSLCCNIIDEVVEDVMETSDYPDYNDSDLRIAIKRTIINLTSIGK